MSDDGKNDIVLPPLLLSSSLSKRVAERLITSFNIMTAFFFRRSVEKAFQLDEQPSDLGLDTGQSLVSNSPIITSAVDDVMYIVNQVVERSLATSQRAVVSNVIPTIARVLGSDFVGMIQRKMRDESYPRAAVQGALPPEHTTTAFLILINNLDVATDYLKRIVQTRKEVPSNTSQGTVKTDVNTMFLKTLFPLNHDATVVANALQSLQLSFEGKTSELISDGVFVVFKNVVKPRLRPILADAFRDIDYTLTQEELEAISQEQQADNGDEDPREIAVQRHFQRGWDKLTTPINRILTEKNFSKLLAIVASYLAEILEKRIWSYYERLDVLGAVRMERDIASIVGAVVSAGRYKLRDAFARCTQICLVMNMENDEWKALQTVTASTKDDTVDWKIDGEERIRARAMVRLRK